MNLGKTMKCFIINYTISFKYTEIRNQTAPTRLRWVLCKFFKFKFSSLRYQLLHFIKVYDNRSITLVWFRDDDDAIIIT